MAGGTIRVRRVY